MPFLLTLTALAAYAALVALAPLAEIEDTQAFAQGLPGALVDPEAGGFGGTPILIWGVTGIASLLIFFLEVFVAFLQAFIFMFLTAVFVSLLMHHDDHDHEEAHDGHDDIAVAAEEAQIA